MVNVVVIPTYNERDTVGVLVPEIFARVPDARVLVVDDSSPDGTAEVVRQMQFDRPNLDLLVRPSKEGLGRAYVDAFHRVLESPDVQTVTTMDADCSHAPEALPTLLAAAEEYDVVVGSRYVPGGRVERWEWWRRALSRGGNLYARSVVRVPIRDITSGFVCFRRVVLEKIDWDRVTSRGYAYTIESKYLAFKTGARVTEVPITFRQRRGGESKITNGIVREGLAAPWLVRR